MIVQGHHKTFDAADAVQRSAVQLAVVSGLPISPRGRNDIGDQNSVGLNPGSFITSINSSPSARISIPLLEAYRMRLLSAYNIARPAISFLSLYSGQ